MLIVREGPEKDKSISKDELRYIQESLGTKNDSEIKHPWKAIFTSKAVYAISASHFAENWGFYTLLTQLPSFLKGTRFDKRLYVLNKIQFSFSFIVNTDTLHFELAKAGFLSAAPYLAMGILLGISGYFADMCQVKGYLTTTQVRKYFNCGGKSKLKFIHA